MSLNILFVYVCNLLACGNVCRIPLLSFEVESFFTSRKQKQEKEHLVDSQSYCYFLNMPVIRFCN